MSCLRNIHIHGGVVVNNTESLSASNICKYNPMVVINKIIHSTISRPILFLVIVRDKISNTPAWSGGGQKLCCDK